jgi:ADP-heptose:LPS heptosyltransferase
LKCIKPEILAEVIKRFQAEAKQCLLLEGPADREAVESLQRLIHQPIRIIKGVDLSLVAGLLSHAALYIGHDAGITHLSGLVGVPTLALFGPTDPERWAPKGSHVRILRGSPCVCLSWEEVQRCKERTCLAVKPESMLDVCGTIDEFINLPLSMAGCRTLSPPNPYAKVARSISLSLVRT